MSVSCFLPCRAGSERVPKKNIKPFFTYEKGLIQIKLQQLNDCDAIDQIVLSTNDVEIIEFVQTLAVPKLKLHIRAEYLSSSSTSTDELVMLAHDICDSDHILWTHVTSPFFTAALYSSAINTYLESLNQGCDSLMSVKELKSFIWNDEGPVNYDRSVEKWPRTQTLKPLYEIDSGVFLNSKSNYKNLNDRIGKIPFLFVSPGYSNFDIDWPDDFSMAQSMLESGIAKV